MLSHWILWCFMVQQWITGIFIHWKNGFVVFTQTFATCYFIKSLSTEGWILLESVLRVKYFMHMYKQLLPHVFLTLKQFHFSFDEHFNSGRNTKVISKMSFSCVWKKKNMWDHSHSRGRPWTKLTYHSKFVRTFDFH